MQEMIITNQEEEASVQSIQSSVTWDHPTSNQKRQDPR
jgi:hypothetical protein